MSDEKYPFFDEVEPEAAPEVEAQPEATQVETPESSAPAEPTAAEPVEGTHVPLAALRAEREKRQAHERRIAELEQAMQRSQPPEPGPDFYSDPTQYVQQEVQGVRQQMTQAFHAALEADAREAYPDYDEVLAELAEAARDNPMLRQQVFASPNPAKAAYKLGRQERERKAMQDPVAYRAKLAAEIRAEIAAEAAAKETARAAAAAAIPPDLSAARSARDQEVVEDDSLDSILASRKRR